MNQTLPFRRKLRAKPRSNKEILELMIFVLIWPTMFFVGLPIGALQTLLRLSRS
jgi:hypothetical protein